MATRLSDAELIQELSFRFIQITKENLELKKQVEILNMKLQFSESLKSNFISNIRNEIINPFSGILGLSKSIQFLNVTDLDKIKTMASLIHLEAFNLDFQLKNII